MFLSLIFKNSRIVNLSFFNSSNYVVFYFSKASFSFSIVVMLLLRSSAKSCS
jgi:hypothetical protein